MNLRGEIRELIKEAQRQVFRHEWLGSGHHRFYAPDHKTIVQCSSSTRDGAWKGKFMTEMRKAGFKTKREVKAMNNGKHATTSLGDIIRAAEHPENVPENVDSNISHAPPRGTYAKVAREVLAREPTRYFSKVEICAAIRARGFAYTEEKAGILLANLAVQGECFRGDIGQYRKLRKHAPEPAAPIVVTEPPVPVLGLEADESVIDDDIRELDEALAALGRIESVVRKYKGLVKQMRAFKAALAGVK